MKRLLALLPVLVLATSLLLALGASPAHAAIVVDETADELNVDGDCSLAEAVEAINTAAAVDACPVPTDPIVSLPAGTYDLGVGVVTMATTEFVGAGADVTVLECSAAPVCINNVGAGASLAVSSLSMVGSAGHHINQIVGTGPLTVTDSVFDTSASSSLRSSAPITVIRSEVIDSQGTAVQATDGATVVDSVIAGADQYGVGADAGPIDIVRSTVSGSGFWGVATDEGEISIVDSTIRGNAGHGVHTDEGAITVHNSTIARNGGHGIETATGAVVIDSSTLAENDFQAFSWVGQAGSVYVVNSILANDTEECDNPAMVSGGHNLTNDALAGCNFDQPTDRVDLDPGLSSLSDNGGTTLTYLPLADSPALDGGGSCPITDQRGESRPADGDDDGENVCDIGAVEVQPTDPSSGGSGSGTGANGRASAARAVRATPEFTG